MKAKFKRLISSLLLVSLLVSTFSVFSVSEVRAEDLVSAVSALAGSEHAQQKASTVATVITGLSNDGYSPEAIAGVLTNMKHESGFNPFIWIGEGTDNWDCYDAFASGQKEFSYSNPNTEGGFGICQWTFGRHVGLSDYCKSSGQPYILIRNKYKIVSNSDSATSDETYACDTGTQIAFLIQEGNAGWTTGNAKLVGLPSISGASEFKTLSSAENAAMYWCVDWERPANKETRAKERAADANAWLQIVNGNYDWANYADKVQAGIVGQQLVGAGYWNEEQLTAYCRVLELNVDKILGDATRTNLGYNEMEGLATWERNIKYDNEDNGVIGLLRRIVMLLGIAIIVWMSLIYLAYWFDRINVVYLDMLGVVTLGHLHMSETEEECTFRIKDLGKEGRKTVNHRAIAGICLVGIAFGVLIVSGWYYVALQKIVHLIQRLLRKVG